MMLNRSVLVFVVLSAWSICQSGSLSASDRSEYRAASASGLRGLVANSKVVPRYKWPWLVAFVVKSDNKFICAGSLISERFVLTAAHSIQNKEDKQPRDPKDVNVYLGKWNLSDATEQDVVLATPAEFIVHHDWNVRDTTWDADIAIAKLADDVTFSRSVQPVCLWTSQMQPDEANDGGIVVGWGETEVVKVSEVPMEAKIFRIPIEDCNKIADLRDAISDRGLCIGGNGTGPCNGDSGGGFFTFQGGKWFLRGITSVSRLNVVRECDVDAPAIFTNVEKFLPWIDQVLDVDNQMECNFYDWYGLYMCRLQNSFTRKDTKIFQVSGSHVGGRTNADVRFFKAWYNSKLKFLPITLGRFFPNLEYYFVFSSGLEQISRNNFAGLPKLMVLQISGTPLKVIPVDAFYDLTNLEEFLMGDNQIEAIDSDTFIHNTKLGTIYLKDNKITSLDSSTFRNNLELFYIDFSDNLLTSIAPGILTALKKLERVYFRNNTCIDTVWGNGSDLILTPSQKREFKEMCASKCQ